MKAKGIYQLSANRQTSFGSVVASVVLFKLSWLALVVGEQQGLVAAAVLIVIMLSIHPGLRSGIGPVVLIAVLGIALDTAMQALHVLHFSGQIVPGWMMLLWLAFALALSHGLAFLGRLKLFWQGVAGFCTGPAAYLLGARLGETRLGLPLWYSLGVLAVGWAVFLPFSLYLLNKGRASPSAGFKSLVLLCLLLPGAKAAAELQLVGSATFKAYFFPVYEAYLYAEHAEPEFPLQESWRFGLVYQRDFSSAQIVNETLKQWQLQQIEIQEDWPALLHTMIPDIRRGDTLELQAQTQANVVLVHNGREVAQINDAAFLRAFTGIWLAGNTTEPEFRHKLLGKP